MPGNALPDDVFELLLDAREALRSLPASATESPELRSIARAAQAGAAGARSVVESVGGAAVSSALMKAAGAFRSTGHFHERDVLERLASVVAGWERRSRPRKR